VASLWGNVRDYGSQKVTITKRNFSKAQIQSREEFRAYHPRPEELRSCAARRRV